MLKTIVTLSKSLNIRQDKCPTNPKESETLLIGNSTLVCIVSKSQTLYQLKSSSTNVRVTQLRRRSLIISWGTSLQPWSSPWGASLDHLCWIVMTPSSHNAWMYTGQGTGAGLDTNDVAMASWNVGMWINVVLSSSTASFEMAHRTWNVTVIRAGCLEVSGISPDTTPIHNLAGTSFQMEWNFINICGLLPQYV